MGISHVRLLLFLLGLTFIALALSLNLADVIADFLAYTHDVAGYPGFAYFPQ